MSENLTKRIEKYDGQSIFINGQETYELGNYLGGGASGSVYQACDLRALPEDKTVAVKVIFLF